MACFGPRAHPVLGQAVDRSIVRGLGTALPMPKRSEMPVPGQNRAKGAKRAKGALARGHRAVSSATMTQWPSHWESLFIPISWLDLSRIYRVLCSAVVTKPGIGAVPSNHFWPWPVLPPKVVRFASCA